MPRAAFLSELRVEEIDDGHWRLLDAFEYDSAVLGQTIRVPAGFVTDFASVPRLPLVYLLTGDTAHAAAVIHDYLYRTHLVTRAEADAVLFEAMGTTGEPLWRRWLMWVGVRVGGWLAWRHPPSAPGMLPGTGTLPEK